MDRQILDVRSAAALTAAAACWGIATVITKGVLSVIPPLTLLVVQLAWSVLALWIVVALRGRGTTALRPVLKLGAAGLLNPGIAYTLSLLGLTATTVTMSTLLWALEPVLILGLVWLLLREPLTLTQSLYSLTALAGVVLVGGVGGEAMTQGTFTGNLLVLGGVLCCALYTVLVRAFGTGLDPLLVVAVQQTFALCWALLLWPIELRIGQPLSLAEVSRPVWLWASASGIIYYALAFWCYVDALRQVPATLGGPFLNLIPIFGMVGAYMFLGERLGQLQWLGAGITLLSIFLILRESMSGANLERRTPTPD